MGVIFDILGAVVIGTIVLMTIITSILNFQEFHYNIRTMITMAESGEKIVEMFDKHYLSNIERIDWISPSKIYLKGKLDLTEVDSIIVEIGKTKQDFGYPVSIKVVNMANNSVDTNLLPLLVSDTLAFTFYDINMNVVTSNDSLSSIRNIRVNFNFIEKGWERKEGEKKVITHPVSFWKCFKTIYINSLSN